MPFRAECFLENLSDIETRLIEEGIESGFASDLPLNFTLCGSPKRFVPFKRGDIKFDW